MFIRVLLDKLYKSLLTVSLMKALETLTTEEQAILTFIEVNGTILELAVHENMDLKKRLSTNGKFSCYEFARKNWEEVDPSFTFGRGRAFTYSQKVHDVVEAFIADGLMVRDEGNPITLHYIR